MFDLLFYELIKWALNFEDETKEYFHKRNIVRTRTKEMNSDIRFSLLVLRLTTKEDTNLSNIDMYMGGYYEYFMK
jgi:hypothetical protein